MKVLILGGSGMLGHKLWQELSPQLDTHVTLREDFSAYSEYGLFDPSRSKCHVSVFDIGSVEAAIEDLRPDVVVNCIGAVKQTAEAKDPFISIAVNSLFPHQLAQFCRAVKSRLIHISTDCVFSGREGNYSEDDLADAEDLYGRTKFLGEVAGEGCMTIRTSMVGRELQSTNGLIEWFMSQEGKTVPGYMRSIFSGLTTNALAKLIVQIVNDHRDTDGIWHVASEPIRKHDLLCMVKEVYGFNIEITPDETHIVDRTLNGDRFRKRTGYVTPSWQEMIEEMHQDPTPYSEIRRSNADR
jgi:dTDP-4-dehydrorhamnose reductase